MDKIHPPPSVLMITQIFGILPMILGSLENSFKYSNPCGSAKLSITNNKQDTIIKVVDTGMGIFEEHQERMFEDFIL